MNIRLILGLAAIAGVVYFLRSAKGKALLDTLAEKVLEGVDKVGDQYEDKLSAGADQLRSLTHKVADTSNVLVV